LNMTPTRIIMDFEASALHKGYPIEVGVALSFPDHSIGAASKLIRHDPWLERGLWDANAQSVHKIPKSDLYEKGEDVRAVCLWLNDSLLHETVIVSHYKDKGWLYQLFDAARSVPLFEIREVAQEIDAASSVDERALREIMRDAPHRAASDAKHLARALDLCLTA
jgi:hypothetical protein